MSKIKIGGATLNQTPLDWNNNFRNISHALEQARSLGIKILCLPELCITGYGCEDVFLSDWLSEKAMQVLLRIVPLTEGITVNIGLPIRIQGITYNGSCVISNTKILGITLKQNLANDGVHYEPRWFKPWKPKTITTVQIGKETIQAGDPIYEVDGIRIGIEICEDGWSREKRPGYEFLKRNVNLILNPSASHFAMGKSTNREEEVVVDGSRKFKCVYLFVNHLGNEAGRMIYDGDILIAQQGKLLAQNNRLSFQLINLLACEVDFIDPINSEQLPLRDSKDRMDELTRAVTLGLFDYLRKSRSKGYVLSLSGGADSSSCATMVAEMVNRACKELGWTEFKKRLNLDNSIQTQQDAVRQLLTCVYQATQNSSESTLESARKLAESLGAEFHLWSIQDEVNSYSAKIETALSRKLSWQTDDVALQNIQARTRSPIIWMLANIKNCILLTTSNRSEGDVGYATMDGDTSGSLAPVSGINKVTILEWLRWAENTLGYSALKYVNQLTPTAELRPLERHQTDEEDLMPYPVLAQIERHAILMRKSPAEVFHHMKSEFTDRTILKSYIRKFFRLWAINQWKRERLAPSFHLDELNVDPRTWCRFPILSSGFEEELAELESLE